MSTDSIPIEDDISCNDLADDYFYRRYIDLVLSCIGLVLGILHFILLLFIRYAQKHKGFFLMLIQAAVSAITMFFLVLGCMIDICAIQSNPHTAFFRAYVWVFLVNTLIACYGFIVVALCLDRYVALNNPLYYKLSFSRLKARLTITFMCFTIAILVCIKWVIFNKIEGGDDFVENQIVSHKN